MNSHIILYALLPTTHMSSYVCLLKFVVPHDLLITSACMACCRPPLTTASSPLQATDCGQGAAVLGPLPTAAAGHKSHHILQVI
jgi:hypothetical protein